MDYESFLELAERRRSYWEFRPDPIPDAYVEKIVDAARYAPSGFNSQPWEFVVIVEPELRQAVAGIIAKHGRPPGPGPGGLPPGAERRGGSPPGPEPRRKDPMGFKTAPVLIILFGDTRVRDFGPPGMKHDDKRWQSTFTSSLAIAYQYMHLAATSLGLASKWVSAVSSPLIEEKLKELLGIPKPFVAYDLMAIGHSDFQPPPKTLRELSEVLHFGKSSEDDFRTEEEVREHFRRR
ncbi:nitroreductase family protein [Chloroflexota bacterium]